MTKSIAVLGGQLGRLLGSRQRVESVDVSAMSGPQLAAAMTFAQLGAGPYVPTVLPRRGDASRSGVVAKPKLSSRERRLARMRSGSLTLEKLNSGLS